ncbi:hypothetical protein [uncultured Shewanella sp.]|uniref:hypothetical protein n=1 Tax=uncultured Shewanella sp. TaxID=173975 RepID=UPI00262CCF5A|nr:hypothetical protein [uncultured Shewanella sp.]
MKNYLTYIALFLSILSVNAIANPSIANLKVGETTEIEMKKLYKAKRAKLSPYSKGNVYSIPAQELGIQKLDKVTAIFDEHEILSAVHLHTHKRNFDYFNDILGQKYRVVSEKIPFVGSSHVLYEQDDAVIFLNAPHMNFEMTISYMTVDFFKKRGEIRNAEAERKKEADANLL